VTGNHSATGRSPPQGKTLGVAFLISPFLSMPKYNFNFLLIEITGLPVPK
jgi:hypothetical protein